MNADREQASDRGAAAKGAAQPGSAATGSDGGIGDKAGAAASRAADEARRMGDRAREAASTAGAKASEQARRLADRQVESSADMVAKIGESVRVAADHLEPDLPQLAYVTRTAADWIDDYSEALRERSAEELVESSAEFARRHPAMVFTAAAGAGFLLFRLFTAQGGGGRPGAGERWAGGRAPDWLEEGGVEQRGGYHAP